MRNTHSNNLLPPPSTTLNIQFLTNVSFTGWNRGWKLSDSMYHHYYGNNQIKNDDKGFTIMSADLDGDNEPDNCFFFILQGKTEVYGDVFGGGNKGRVDGNATVNIKD